MNSLRIQQASFSYNREVSIFENVNFDVEAGETLCILGQNGIGKTTLLKCIAGILTLDSGTISFCEEKVTDSGKNLIQHIGYVQQMHQPVFSYLVEDMVLMGKSKQIGLFSAPKKKDYEEVYELLALLQILDKAKIPCSFLSGGQLQLVYIARALISNPKILILDEPESHLDYKNQKMILKTLSQLIQEKKLIGIINTHYPEHAMKYSDKVLFLGKNKNRFGISEDLISEEILFEYFETPSKIINFEHEGRAFKSIVAL